MCRSSSSAEMAGAVSAWSLALARSRGASCRGCEEASPARRHPAWHHANGRMGVELLSAHAILARPIADDLGVPASYGLVRALTGALDRRGLRWGRVSARKAIDRFGGRGILRASNVVFALGLIVLASAHGVCALAAGVAVASASAWGRDFTRRPSRR